MLKKDFLNEANRVLNDFKGLSETDKVDEANIFRWVGNALGLIRVYRPELAGSIRDRNHPFGTENTININTFACDAYCALVEATTCVQTLAGDDSTV